MSFNWYSTQTAINSTTVKWKLVSGELEKKRERNPSLVGSLCGGPGEGRGGEGKLSMPAHTLTLTTPPRTRTP